MSTDPAGSVLARGAGALVHPGHAQRLARAVHQPDAHAHADAHDLHADPAAHADLAGPGHLDARADHTRADHIRRITRPTSTAPRPSATASAGLILASGPIVP